jgi:hypothetical protein
MIRKLPTIVLVLTTSVAVAQVAEQKPSGAVELTEVVIADRYRTAFYEVAPRSVAKSMKRAVEHVCAERQRRNSPKSLTPSHESETGWLCNKSRLRFFRDVDVMGGKWEGGFVCSEDAVGKNLKFLIDAMAENDLTSCVQSLFDDNAGSHYLWFQHRT